MTTTNVEDIRTHRKRRCEKRWKRDDAKVSALLDNLLSYKTEMEFQGLDFQSDLVLCYSKVREMMANNFPPW